jgi:hypothetical protein
MNRLSFSFCTFPVPRAFTARLRLVVATIVITGSACTDLDIVPAGALVSCSADGDCPAGLVCRLDVERCIPSDVANEDPIAIAEPLALSASRVSRVEAFARFTATVGLSRTAESLDVTFDNRLSLTCADGASTTPTCSLDLAALPGDEALDDGAYDVVLRATDAAGNVATSRARITLDTTPPNVVEGTVTATYTPRAGNPLFAPRAAGPLTDAVVRLVLDEAPGAAPTAALDNGAARVDVPLDSASTLGLLVAVDVAPGDDDDVAALAVGREGPVALVLTLVDDVGNVREVVLDDAVTLDGTPPAAAATMTPGLVTHLRRPYGTRAAPGAAFDVVGNAGAVEAGAHVFVTSDAAFDSGRLGDGDASDDGAFAIALAPVDVPRVFLHVVDAAGNRSAAARVQDIAWTASTGGRARGQPRSNPHTVFATGNFDGASLDPVLTEEDASAAALVDGAGVTVNARSAFVRRAVLGAQTPPRVNASLAWHAARGQLMAFGGSSSVFTLTNELHALVGETWELVVVDGPVPPPALARMVYDPDQERLVVVQDGGDTWIFVDGGWEQLPFTAPSRSGAALLWDPVRRQVVRFGGAAAGDVHNDLWLLHDDGWHELNVAGDRPSGRSGTALAADLVDGVLVLWGGDGLLDDLWTFDANDQWHLIGTPGPVRHAQGVTEPLQGRAQFVDGLTGFGDAGRLFTNRARTFDGSGLVDGPVMIDEGAEDSAAAWDPVRQRLVVLGGLGNAVSVGALPQRFLSLEGDAWRAPPTTLREVGPGDNARTAWDPVGQRVLLQAGEIELGAIAITSSTRAWDGVQGVVVDDGTRLAPSAPLFFDGTAVVAVGGSNLLSLTDGAWIDQGPVPTGMPASDYAAVWNEGANVGFVFGGRTVDNQPSTTTFTIAQGVVTDLHPATTPSTGFFPLLTWDDVNGRVVMFDPANFGNADTASTWVFVDNDWRQLGPFDAETSARLADVTTPRLVFDKRRGVTVLLSAGSDATGVVVDELRDDTWVRRNVDVAGGGRRFFNAAWDDVRQEVFVQGGKVNGRSQSDVLLWDGGVGARPALALVVDLGDRGARGDVIDGIDVAGAVGGDGRSEPTAQGGGFLDAAGADVLVWGDAWEPLASAEGTATAPATFAATIDDEAQLARTAKRRFVVVVTPRGTTGDTLAATVHADALEVTVRYHEP